MPLPSTPVEFTYLVEYDLKKTKHYTNLITAIQKLNHTKLLLSSWLIRSIYGAKELNDHLKQFIDSDDVLVVIEVKGDWATLRADKKTTDWMQKNIITK